MADVHLRQLITQLQTNLWASSNVVADKLENTLDCPHFICHQLSVVRKIVQGMNQLKNHGEIVVPVLQIAYELVKSWIRVVKSTTKQHAHDDVCHTRCSQSSHVKGTTLLLSHFVYHLFHFHQNPRLHHSPTKTKLFQDGQTQPTIALVRGIVTDSYHSYKKATNVPTIKFSATGQWQQPNCLIWGLHTARR